MYHRLEDGVKEDNLEKHEQALGNVEKTLRSHRFSLKVLSWLLGLVAVVLVSLAYVVTLPIDQQKLVKKYTMFGSIPIVALLFTWFHIWLAIQMMFRPIHFFGIWQYKSTGVGIGWQGVVPRKAEKMAKTAFAQARKYMNGPGSWFDKVNAYDMVERIRPYVKKVLSSTLTEAARKYYPEAWELLGDDVKEELVLAALEKTEATAPDFWRGCTDILRTEDPGVDNDMMVITVFLANKPLLNEFFMTVGANEIKFIERCGAALGFICGVVQLVCYTYLSPVGRAILLPSTGFFSWNRYQLACPPRLLLANQTSHQKVRLLRDQLPGVVYAKTERSLRDVLEIVDQSLLQLRESDGIP
mmetsp:Transcript_116743/g.183580  ORF Transcript_116743/g.183580 Transcript_116743/m.183580 type:complete len:356 (+) Transcript_116743:77-1144(+)